MVQDNSFSNHHKVLNARFQWCSWLKQWAVSDIWVSGCLISSVLTNYTSINKRHTFMLPALTWNWFRFLDIYTLF